MSTAGTPVGTPLMRQYHEIKQQVGDAVLLYRMGDFYESFLGDAETVARVLGITLTRRGNGAAGEVPLAGFPWHQLDRHLPRLVAAGHRVAVCEQAEDPATAKGIVRREVTEVVTRGTSLDGSCLPEREDNLLAAVRIPLRPERPWGLALLDVSTGRFEAMQGGRDFVLDELLRASPVEVLFPDDAREVDEVVRRKDGWSSAPARFPDIRLAVRNLCKHFGTSTIEGMGWTEADDAALEAAAAALAYASDSGRRILSHLLDLRPLRTDQGLGLDASTLANLEILHPLHDEDRGACLAAILDRCSTPMGSRRLRRWLARPCGTVEEASVRQAAVAWLRLHPENSRDLSDLLAEVGDLERLAGRLAARRVHPRDLLALRRGLLAATGISERLSRSDDVFLAGLARPSEGLSALADPLSILSDDLPLSSREGGLLRPDADPVCRELSRSARDARESLARLEEREKVRTGIHGLKVGYHRVFGYHLEVTRPHLDKVPPNWNRIQTLANAERFTLPEILEWENAVLGAQERIRAREHEVFVELRENLATHLPRLLEAADALARLDVLLAFARSADRSGWVRPVLTEDGPLLARDLRHPVVEALQPDLPFVPNDLFLDPEGARVRLLTGPNMGGKSTYLRQAGILVVMAMAGCPVAASEARLPRLDRVFTRVGASDRLHRGQSTFLVEMVETAAILHRATPRSLVLLDEVGRGTSTHDGLALAWAIAEHLHSTPGHQALVLFATHYHELVALAERLPGLSNLQVLVREHEGRLVLLHRVAEGACDSSYGLQVARMAGVPVPVLDRAAVLLRELESSARRPFLSPEQPQAAQPRMQLNLFAPDPILEEVANCLRNTDPMQTTPLQALVLLDELRRKLA